MSSPAENEFDPKALAEQEAALEKQLAAIRQQRYQAQQAETQRALAEARRKEQEKQVTVTIKALVGANVLIEGDYREDLVELYKTIPGRYYRGHRENMIPAAEVENFTTKALELQNVTVNISDKVKEDIEYHLHAPVWEIKKSTRYFECKAGPRADTIVVHQIPGAEWQADKRVMRVPLPEGYRLFEKLQETEGVIWDDEAHKFIIESIEKRATLDRIATMERGVKYLDFDMNGVKLREFQEVGCEFIDATGGRALLADEMGLGKTIQALAYAVKNNFRTLVICPASLKANWAREIKRCTGQAAHVLQGAEPTQFDMVEMLTKPAQYSIINYDIFGRKREHVKETEDQEGFKHVENQTRFFWVELINMSKPDLVIVDEGHYIKNVDTNRSQAARQLKAPRVIFMTGTPVLNRPGELFPMLNIIDRTQFPAHETFLNQYTWDGKTARNVEELRQILKSIMIRRLKKDVVAELPPINRINRYHELSAKAQKLYEKVEMGIYETIAEYSASGQGGQQLKVTNILAQIQRLKMVCAIDKAEGTADIATELYEQTDESEARKVLIFSQYKAVAYRIYQMLVDQGALCFIRRTRDGFVTDNDTERDRKVQQFQTDPNIKYLIVTEKTAKEGHNITAAGHVIFNDLFWTPASHEQGEGRAYGRLSNLHSINSYYIVTDMGGDSIEEWIVELLAKKFRMIQEVIEGVEDSRDVNIAMELINRMKERMWTRK